MPQHGEGSSMFTIHLLRLICPKSSKKVLERLYYTYVCHLPVYMGNSPPVTDISWDAAFLLGVIPNMVWWVSEGAWEPSLIVVWVLT